MEKYDLNTDIMMITIMSFLGFCIEDTWMLVRYSYIDNRNNCGDCTAGKSEN